MPIPALASATTCTGCSACANRCPQNAIQMSWTSDGFLRPSVQPEACIRCGLCMKVCPVLQKKENCSIPSTCCYTGWITNEQKRKESSSGGVFTALAERVLEKGGCVFGVALQPDLTAAHICVEDIPSLAKLRGSKYIPSNIAGTFRQAEQMLKKGRYVLFSGTPCEIAGLRTFLRKDYVNLLTCDIACHGAPSHLLFEKYLKFMERMEGSKVSHVSFRNKDSGWLNYSLKSSFEQGEDAFTSAAWSDPFMQGFLSNAALKPACYGCQWHAPHQADLTLADAWGIHTVRPEWDHQNGISLILAHTEKGRNALQEARESSILFLHEENEENAEKLIAANEGLVHQPTPIPRRRERFLKSLEGYHPLPAVLDEHLTSCSPRKLRKDVGIIGLWMTCNYGAILTDFALYRLLQDMGYDPILLDHSLASGSIAQFMDPETPFRRFLREEGIETTRPLNTGSDVEELNDSIDTFMVGSDQMWHIALWEKPELKPLIAYYLLDFVRPDKRKIAFASSFGTDKVSATPETRQWEASLMRLFDSISVREDSASYILKQYYGVQAPQVLDPVFLCSRRYFDQVVEGCSAQEDSNFICSYVLDNRPEIRAFETQLSEQMGCKVVHLTDPETKQNEDFFLNNLRNDIGVPEWLYYISHCQYLITDSYHGMCFAIIYNIPFTAIGNAKRGLTRFESLLRLVGLSNRLITPGQQLDIQPDIDWSTVNQILAEHKERSTQLLTSALTAPRKLHTQQANDAAWAMRSYSPRPTQSPQQSRAKLYGQWLNAATRGLAHLLLARLHINSGHHHKLRMYHGKRRREISNELRKC